MNRIQRLVKACSQALERWAGIPLDAGDGTAYNLGGRVANLCGGVSTVMGLSSAWACVTLLSETISTLPLGMFQRVNGESVSAPDHNLSSIFRVRVNADMTPVTFLSAFIASMLLRGIGYAERIELGGKLIGLDFLNPDCLSCRKVNGRKEYSYSEDGKIRNIPESRIWSVLAFSLDGKTPCSAIRYGAAVFGSAAAADVAARKTFDNGLMPTVAFSTDQVLKKDQRDEFRGTFADTVAGAINSGKPVFLEAGMKGYQLGINPADAQLLESRAYSVEEICSWFRVPPFMIGRASQGQTNWGTGIEQQMIGFVTFALRPMLKRIEAGILKDLIPVNEQAAFYAEFNLEGLLRGDSTARAALYSSALQNGWMSRDEVRRLENRGRIEGGDVYTVQSNLLPIGQLGKAPAAQSAVDALKLALGIQESKETDP